MILYTDEVTPGNVLGVQPRRKSQCIYVSLCELGGAVLSIEDAWLAVAICRSKIMKRVDGGVAQLVGKMLALMLPEFSTTVFVIGRRQHALVREALHRRAGPNMCVIVLIIDVIV